MNIILLGNAVALAGSVLMVLSGLLTSQRRILILQCIQFAVMGLGNLILGGITGAISNVVGILRNVVCCRYRIEAPVKLCFILLQLVLSIAAGPITPIGALPLISGCAYTWFIDLEDPLRFKQLLLGCQLCWLVYDLSLLNLVAAAFDVFTILTSLIALKRLMRKPGTAVA